MRLAMAQPCFGSSETVFRIKRSSVPCTRSFGFAILWLSTISIVDCQGMAIRLAIRQSSLLRYLGDQRDSTGSRDLLRNRRVRCQLIGVWHGAVNQGRAALV